MIGIIARLDNSGLGTLCWEFLRHIQFDQVKVVSNGRYPVFRERGYNFVGDLTTDVVLSFETFYGVRKKPGQKFILVPMYECTSNGDASLADEIIAPSLLDQRVFKSKFIPIPVARDRVPFKKRLVARTFLHNAGHGGLGGRNGTGELLEALAMVKKDIRVIINSQIPIECKDPRVDVRVRDVENYWENWGEGDVFVFPEKFNGLSLPIQEAMSSGMPIICTDRYPFNAYLPRELMIKGSTKTERIAREFVATYPDPKDLARIIDEVAGSSIIKLSEEMDGLAQSLSWDKLQHTWQTALKG